MSSTLVSSCLVESLASKVRLDVALVDRGLAPPANGRGR